MSPIVPLGLAIALLAGTASIAIGRNLTRQVAAVVLSLLGLATALLAAGTGFLALYVVIPAALVTALVQLFGWMLVDVDRDHVPRTDRATAFARSLAFALLAGALLLLAFGIGGPPAAPGGLPAAFGGPPAVDRAASTDVGPVAIGALLLGPWQDLATLFGLVVAATLLASFMLLRDDRPPS